MALSLFEERLHPHHFTTEQDVAEEFFALLTEAKNRYLHDVVTDGKQYHRYVDDFVNSHRYIGCDCAVCKNCHEVNIHIIKGLLTDYAQFIKHFFAAEVLSFEGCMALKRMYDMSGTPPIAGTPLAGEPVNTIPLSFGCNFSREQMIGIVSCANAYHLFHVSTLRIEDLEALFACREGFSIRVNNIRHVVILFDALLENLLIQPRWQSVLNRGRFLRTKDGTKFVTASSLSSALSAVRNNKTAVAYSIRRAIGLLKE